jgi:hypothetical protein
MEDETMRSFCLSSALVVTLLAALPAVAAPPGAGDGWLITPDEAALAEAPPETPPAQSIRLRGAKATGAGPTIEMVTPEEGTPVAAPVSVFIRFAANQAPVDLSTLKVVLLKVVKIDITDRLRPYVSDEGIRIDEGKFPSGKFRLRVTLADVNGNLTTGEGALVVL